MQVPMDKSLSPSFSIYSKVAEIAARTVDEFDSDEFSDEMKIYDSQRGDESDDEFEFSTPSRESELPSQTSADDVSENGKFLPFCTVFNRYFLNEIGKENSDRDSDSPKIRLPLRKLFREERETTISMAEEELDGVDAVTYCVWPPKDEGRCKKSSSAGSNLKRWKLKDFLHRSHSHGSRNDFNGGEKQSYGHDLAAIFDDANALTRNSDSF
ncbi:uncharacterized protein LOC125208460 [Salvia hispanica]|uniref:uncharacterized protein LOC125208460 n=1 Tax=Salvia hispanica TaxID=49212 RepID=UPI00200995A9|nr:uncharacterized protein LOC125208460 [Salvia hispanica]